MDNSYDKVEFYGLGAQRTNFDKLEEINNVGQNPIKNGLNSAKKTVLMKDITILENKIKSILNSINTYFSSRDFEKYVEGNLENIDELMLNIEKVADEIILEKEKNKVNIFSSDKKNKKKKAKELQECLEYLAKSQNEILSIKNEYNKIKEKNASLISEEKEKTKFSKKEDPLERTIKFYMNKV